SREAAPRSSAEAISTRRHDLPTQEEISRNRCEWLRTPEAVTPERLSRRLLKVLELTREVAALKEAGMHAKIVPVEKRLANNARLLWRDYCWLKSIDPEPPLD